MSASKLVGRNSLGCLTYGNPRHVPCTNKPYKMCNEFSATQCHSACTGLWSPDHKFPFLFLVAPWQEERQWAQLLVAFGLGPTVGLAGGHYTVLTAACVQPSYPPNFWTTQERPETSVESVQVSSYLRFPAVEVKHLTPALGDDLDWWKKIKTFNSLP